MTGEGGGAYLFPSETMCYMPFCCHPPVAEVCRTYCCWYAAVSGGIVGVKVCGGIVAVKLWMEG